MIFLTSSWFYPTANHGPQRADQDLIVERYQSGEVLLNVLLNTLKAIISKWRKWDTTVTVPKTGYPYKIDKRTNLKLVREATKRPRAMLNELQEYL